MAADSIEPDGGEVRRSPVPPDWDGPVPTPAPVMVTPPLPDAAAALPSGEISPTSASAKPAGPPSAVWREQVDETAVADPEDASQDEKFDISMLLARDAPPWLVSAVVHMLALIAFATWFLTAEPNDGLQLDITYAEELGDQLDDMPLELADEMEELVDPILTPDDLDPVDDPIAAPDPFESEMLALNQTTDETTEIAGVALSGREKGMKEALLSAYGGTGSTEAAVLEGLRWLARNQRKNGLWSISGPYIDGLRGASNDEAATAMALLAFQGAGHTHQMGPDEPFADVVARGWRALLALQQDDGSFFRRGPGNHRLYTHAQCTIALCELFAMTRDDALRKPAQRAVDYCISTQAEGGGWRYHPGMAGDTSVTGWFVMALKSAQMAGLDVSSESLLRVSEFLDRVSHDDGARYSYLPREVPKLSMTAEGLLCRQYLGWKRDDPRLVAGVERLLENLVDWDEQNVYYWYYAAQVCHHMEGPVWQKWNAAMRQVLPENQVKSDRERGSWDPGGDRWGDFGGRLYVTCLSIYMLEVYYRHLPIYRQEMIAPSQ